MSIPLGINPENAAYHFGFGLGHVVDLYDARDLLIPGGSALAYPASVAPLDGDFPIYDQEQSNACTAFSVKEAAQIVYKRATGLTIEVSARFIWWGARLALGWTNRNAGCAIRDAIQFVNAAGLPSEGKCAWDQTKYAETPSPAAYEQGADHKAFGYARTETLAAAKAALAAGNPVVFGTTLTDAFNKTTRLGGFFAKPEGAPLGAHAMTIVGYDDTVDCSHAGWSGPPGAFRVRNHWRASFGDKGRFWMPYQHFNSGAVTDKWALTGIAR